jgi:hypothetical protein
MSSLSVTERLRKLGLKPGGDVPTDRIDPAIAALACFPMYMVANVHAWTDDHQFRVPLLDLPGSEQVREAFAIGQQEARLPLDEAHRKVLGALLSHARPADRIIYDYALETLRDYLDQASPAVSAELRGAVARMIVAVAESSGKGFLGTGRKVTPEERHCIHEIAAALDLDRTPEAAEALRSLAG